MRTSYRRGYVALLALAPWAAGCSMPGVHQEGQVKQVGELPCFSVANSKEARNTPPRLAILTVDQRIDGREVSIWTLSFRDNPMFRLSPDDCIVYGELHGGTALAPTPPLYFTADGKLAAGGRDALAEEAPVGPPPVLQPGERYHFDFNSSIPDKSEGHRLTRVYSGDFCVTKDPAGKTEVHQVLWDKKAKTRRWDVCGMENEP